MVPAKFCLHRCPAALRQSCCARREFGSSCSIISSTVPRKNTCHGWRKRKGGQRNQKGWQTREHRWWSLPSICVGDASASGQVGPRCQPKSGSVRWSLLAAHWHMKNCLGHLSYISSLPDESTLQLPSLCLHHRAGNIIEKMTELTGSLTGHYAFSRPRGSEENIECLCRRYATPDFRSLTRFPQTLVRNSKGPLAEPVRKGFFFLACTDETKSKIDDIVSGLRAFLQGGGLDCFWVGIGAASQVVPWQVGLVPVFGAWLH